jgi:tetratricopeptide (TPR) repeat protein
MIRLKKTLFILFFLQFLFVDSYKAQLSFSKNNNLLFKADKAFELGDLYSALTIYKQLYLLDSNDADLNYKIGICSFELKKFRIDSKKYFDKLSYKKYPEADYYLGILNHLKRNYESAIFHFKRYKKYRQKEHSTKEIDDLIGKCNTAILYESVADNRIQISNMGSVINTEYDEYAPLIPADESFMIFTSRRKNPMWEQKDVFDDYFEDIYLTINDSTGWHAPQMLDTNFNTPVHDASTGLSADGERLLIYRTSENFKSGDIYESFLIGGKWTKPAKLGNNINSAGNVQSSACYSTQGDIIFFSSDRPGGYGGKDLYMSRKLPNGDWGLPKNLGSNINTEYNEDAPFVHSIGNVLYFSSQGHSNMGGYDIFNAEFDEKGDFSIPKNLGYPMNTVDDDIFFVLNPDGSTGYFSSAREGGLGGQDLYSVSFAGNNTPLDVYSLYVLDETSGNIIKEVEMNIVDLSTKNLSGIYKSNERTGKVLFISESKKEYQLIIRADGYKTFVGNVVFYDFNREKLFTLKKTNN